jgi:hypothetical protein
MTLLLVCETAGHVGARGGPFVVVYLLPAVVIALDAIVLTRLHAAVLETGGVSRRAEVVASELLEEFLVPVDDAVAAPNARLAQGTPFAACSCAQKESRVSNSCSWFLAIWPPC